LSLRSLYRLSRIAALGALTFALLPLVTPVSQSSADDSLLLAVVADRDDDDGDGQKDGEQAMLPEAARADLVRVPQRVVGQKLFAYAGAERARMVVNGRPLPWGSVVPAGASIQGIEPGFIDVVVDSGGVQNASRVLVFGAGLKDGEMRQVDLVHDRFSLERTPPERVEGDVSARYDDPDALRITLEAPPRADAVPRVHLVSYSASGQRTDELDVPLERSTCERGRNELSCFASIPVRLVVDDVDRRHALVSGRSLRGEVGGAVEVQRDGRKLLRLRVGSPRLAGVAPAYTARIRAFVVRFDKGGQPSIGTDDRSAADEVRSELALAGAIWGQCGVTFTGGADVHVVDPPPSHLVAFGDTGGVGASGGSATLLVDKKAVRVVFTPGMGPVLAAQAFVRAVEKEGFVGTLSTNARTMPGARPGADVSVRRPGGELAKVALTSPPDDATMTVRVGHIDFADGLDHFTDSDSVAGTLEERTLVKALDDGDPTTIEVIIIPRFSGSGRIGESFISSDFSSLRNVVLIDRAGIRARSTSLTLAHEIGHVVLDMPGHPDDYGTDTPTLLMDSDAADASPFGPRRLTREECARAIRQSGPGSRVQLLTPSAWLPFVPRVQPATAGPLGPRAVTAR
jgi:hypothetical protein